MVLCVFLFLGCNGSQKAIDDLNDGNRAICRLFGERIFDIQQTPEEVQAQVVTTYRIISECITVYADGLCEWSFKYIDEEQNHVLKETLPENLFASLITALKKDKRFELKDGVFELRYDLANSSISYPKVSGEIMIYLDDKYKKLRENNG